MTTWKSAASGLDDDDPSKNTDPSTEGTNERRRDACASACEGIPTEELEKGILLELVAACVRMRDDERLTEILNRLIPPRVNLRPVPPPESLDDAEQIGEEPPPEADPILEHEVADDRQPATEAFRIGMRVRLSAEGIVRMPATSASPRGVVTGFSRSAYEVRVARDGRATPERFPMEFWEPDPDHGDLNASLVSGVYAPVRGERPASRIAGRLPAPGWRRPLRPAD